MSGAVEMRRAACLGSCIETLYTRRPSTPLMIYHLSLSTLLLLLPALGEAALPPGTAPRSMRSVVQSGTPEVRGPKKLSLIPHLSLSHIYIYFFFYHGTVLGGTHHAGSHAKGAGVRTYVMFPSLQLQLGTCHKLCTRASKGCYR